MGRFNEAAVYEAEATRLADQTQHAYTIGQANMAATALHVAKGEWAQARSRIERWLDGIRSTDIKYWIPVAVSQSALVLAQLGETTEASNQLKEGEQLVEQLIARGNLALITTTCFPLGQACLLLGRVEDAQRLGSRAMEAAAARPATVPHVLWLLAEIAGHPGRVDPEHAETCYRKAMAAAEAQQRRPVLAHCHFGLGKLFSRIGKRREADEHLSIASTMYRGMDMRFWLRETEAVMRESS